MNKLKLATSVKSVILEDKLTPRQLVLIGMAQEEFSKRFANTNYRAEIVTTANLDYNNLTTLEDASDARHAGFYANGAVKIWLATIWVDDKEVYPDSKSKQIFKSKSGELTHHVSIGTFLGTKKIY
ncbi:hypothetical protein EBR25_13340 [bacterium]|nr:hypothetical protein [bacterium]